jgi:hypothetical protein
MGDQNDITVPMQEIELSEENIQSRIDNDLKSIMARRRENEHAGRKSKTLSTLQKVMYESASDMIVGGVEMEEWRSISENLTTFIICFNSAIFRKFLWFFQTEAVSYLLPLASFRT